MDSKNQNKENSIQSHNTKKTPERQYREAIEHQNEVYFAVILLLLAELGLGIYGINIAKTYDIPNRVLNELENRTTGQIEMLGGVYKGATDFGYITDAGTLTYDSGVVYQGQWTNNELSGMGDIHIPDEGTYHGAIVNGVKEGAGTFTWNDGTVYKGNWANDAMNGVGVYTTSDGTVLGGTFQDNQFLAGKCKFQNDTGEYTLEFDQGDIDRAEITYADGTTYDGECTEDGLNGTGTMTFVNGDIYKGEFVDNKRDGTGTYKWNDGASYSGIWKADQMNGKGVYYYADNEKGLKLSGTFKDGKPDGSCYYYTSSSNSYITTWSDGKCTAVK